MPFPSKGIVVTISLPTPAPARTFKLSSSLTCETLNNVVVLIPASAGMFAIAGCIDKAPNTKVDANTKIFPFIRITSILLLD